VEVQRSDCQFPRNDLVVLLDIALHYNDTSANEDNSFRNHIR